MDFRIGINVGDVLVDGTNLYGDGVNIAARLESIAEPGGICISGSVFALVKNKLSYGFEDIGLQTMKNIPEPVPAFKLAPSSVTKQAPTGGNSARKWVLPVAMASAIVAIAVVSMFLWAERGNERVAVPGAVPSVTSAAPPATPPPSTTAQPKAAAPSLPATSGQLDAATLERMRPYVGSAVEGISNVTGKSFVMKLESGGVAEVKVELATAGFTLDHGTWWIERNGHFCVRYTHFAGGNIVCRELSVEGGNVKAYTRDHKPNPWVFKKLSERQ